VAGSGAVHPIRGGARPGVVAALDPARALGPWRARGRVAVAIPDLTRPLDPRPALDALRCRIEGELDVVVGLGLHRPMTAEELAPLAAWSPSQHDPDDCVPTDTVDGIPGAVGRPIAQADTVVSVGVAELHQYAGVSGGHKGVAVGCGGRATLSALHHRDRVLDPGVRIGRVAGNPFRSAVDGLGEAARCTLALVWVPAARLWMAGEPRAVVQEAVARIAPWSPEPRRWAGAVLRVPRAKASSLYQASRAATYLALSPSPPLQPGARLVLDAACPEGIGSEAGFVAALGSCTPPWSALLTGPPPSGAGAQRAVMLALLAQHFQLEVAGCDDPSPLIAAGIPATRAPAPTGPEWLDVPAPFTRLPQWTPA